MKQLWSKSLAFLLCLAQLAGMLPVTALAADGGTVYVGGVKLSGSTDSPAYATTDDNGTVTIVDASADKYNIKWDGSTLTLDGAKIKGGTSSESLYATVGIYAFSNSGDVSLNIALKGVNEIFDSSHGIWVYSSSSGTASLDITGENGSTLIASGSSSGILVQSNSGNAALTIQNADVTAENSSSSGDDVTVRAGSSSSASLSVDGGSLTATGKNESGAGIQYTFGSSSFGSGTPSLNVSGNTIVRANGGISDNSSTDIQIGEDSSGTSGGIVFDGNTGTVYGDVTLQEDLTIGEGESLTLDSGASLDANGHNVIVDGGTLGDSIKNSLGNSVKYTPTITTTSLPNGTEGTSYSQTLTANGTTPITWSIAEDSSLPDGLTLNSDGSITGIPPATGTSTFTVTATNDYGSDSKEFTLTIDQQGTIHVTSVSLDKASLELTEGGTGTLIATVEPNNATNKNVTWESSNTSVATVDANGLVTAVSAGTATITVTTVDGNKTAACTVTVKALPEPEPEPEPTPPPYIPPSKPNWTSVARKLANAQPGDTVTVKMNGETEVPGEVWETIAGRDVTVILDMGGNVSWTVDGNDVPTATHFADMDFGVDRNTTGIDVDVINAITGEVSSVQITLAHDGEFGFTLTLTAPLGKENAGYWANLYHYDEDAKTLNYETSGEIQEDGTASLKMTHASQYAIIIDEQTHQLPFEDVPAGAWYEQAVRYAYLHDIMEGMSATTFQPNGTLSRAMAVQIFYNLEGQPDISGENLGYPYEDVNAQAWYGDAVYWARITGVATGYGDGTFQPTDSITRQEFAQMLYNYAKYKDYDLTAEGDLSQFPDSGSVADWAEIAMSWANGNELINGHDNGTIDAAGIGTRAQAASILMRFDQNLVEK